MNRTQSSVVGSHLIEALLRDVRVVVDGEEHAEVDHALNLWYLQQVVHVFDQLAL